MVVITGKGTISVTEPGRSTGTYYEDAEITVYGSIIHFFVYGKTKSAHMVNVLISWDAPPTVELK